jgi:hypothetical protein
MIVYMLSVVILTVIMLAVIVQYPYSECDYTELHGANSMLRFLLLLAIRQV